jgi:putative ABC transport system permease protein
MSVFEALGSAFRSLASSKLRTFLTTLGIVIGVASVMAMVAVGEGARLSVTEQVQSLGANLIMVNVNSRNSPHFVRPEDADLLLQMSPAVNALSPSASQAALVQVGSSQETYQVEGVGADYFAIRGIGIGKGRAISSVDVTNRSAVAVIGPDVASKLFAGRDPRGELVKVGSQNLRVVGVLTSAQSMASNSNNRVYLPISTFERLSGVRRANTWFASAASPSQVDTAQRELVRAIRSRLGSSVPEDQVQSITQEQILNTVNQITAILTLLLSAIAGISLLVGGIGIMNIMLVSVTERTREIGLRQAVGAKRRDILLQFLLESVVLSLTGGALGVLLGWGGASVVAALAGWPRTLPLWAVLAGLGSAVVEGLVFGIYPAARAARLDPIAALHYE